MQYDDRDPLDAIDPNYHRVRLFGGPYDGALIFITMGESQPTEIILRNARYAPLGDSIYIECGPDDFTETKLIIHVFDSAYKYAGSSEMARFVHTQARMVLNREDELRRLQKRFARLQERYNRHQGAVKSAATRKRKRINKNDPHGNE